jgi:ribosomal protein S21
MLIVEVKNNNIEKALKVLKGKVIKTKQLNILKGRKEFQKKSVKRRTEINKAKYVQSKKDSESY